MSDRVLLEEFHLSLTVPRSTPEGVREAIRRAVNGRAFRAALRGSIREVFCRFPDLVPVRVTLTA